MSVKLPLFNLPRSDASIDSYERRLNVKLNEALTQMRLEINKDNGWKDLTSSVRGGKIPGAAAPTDEAFGPSGARKEYAFAINDYIWLESFHINHDIKVGGAIYPHVHWSTNGTSTATVKWSLEILRAKGHNQENFAAPVTVTVEQAAAGTAWRHMITEVGIADALTLNEPDELLMVTLKRVTNGGVNNTDTVFAMAVDFHYESDRSATPQKAPNFYT